MHEPREGGSVQEYPQQVICHQCHLGRKFHPKYITFLLIAVTKMLEEVWREHEVSPGGLGVWITLQQLPPIQFLEYQSISHQSSISRQSSC